MNPEFWMERWRTGQIGFHRDAVHDDLLRDGARWLGAGPQRVLVPLCGKSHDLLWLAARAEVLGVELVEDGITAFFAEHHLTPIRAPAGPYEVWSAAELPSLTILRGDIFDLAEFSAELPASWRLDTITRVWDRAALVALTRPQRATYARNLRTLLNPGTTMLLNVFDVGPDLDQGAPHSVQQSELEVLYADCPMTLLHSTTSEPTAGFKARGFNELLTLTWEIELRRED